VDIATGEVSGGRLPRNAARIVRDWVLRRQNELMDNWQRGRRHEAFQRIAGPDEEA
jgi:hypothetical protein